MAVETIAVGLKFPEGPVFDKLGHLYVCEMQRKQLTRISPDGTTEKYLDTGGVPNGAIRGLDGRLILCDNTLKAIIAVTVEPGEHEKKIELITKAFGPADTPFKGPNDVVSDRAGNLYFTDPVQSSKKNPVGGVYRYDAKTKATTQLINNFAFPNGIVLSDDERTLYIAETEAQSIWAYARNADGSLGQRQLAGELKEGHGPDGIALDSKGRLIAAWFGGKCLAVFEKGKLTEKIDIPDQNPTNIEFGGTKHDELYITGSKDGTVLKLKWPCPGQKMAAD